MNECMLCRVQFTPAHEMPVPGVCDDCFESIFAQERPLCPHCGQAIFPPEDEGDADRGQEGTAH